MKKTKSEETLVEIWDDVVDLASLVKGLLIATVATMGAYYLAPSTSRPTQLLFGLSGAVVGFIINTWLFKPKRHISTKENNHDN